MSARETLLDMGFTPTLVDRALEVSGNQGVEQAMEWILAHAEEMEQSGGAAAAVGGNPPAAEPPSTQAAEPAEGTTETGDQPQAKSIKCNECDKLFRTQAEIEFHAAKSGHSDFAESTEEKRPLTEEEKQQQLKLIEKKLAEKKKLREEQEKAEALEREKKRIQAGKEMVNIKKRLEDEELRKAIEQRKRDKEEDRLARQKIKDQIEADRAARRAKQAGEEPPAPKPTPAPQPAKPAVKKDYTETRLQIRLLNGQSLTQTFGAKEQLSAVRLYVEMNRTDGGDGSFSLMTNFPKKIFSSEDYDKPLEALGLVPSAVLIVTKANPNPA